MKRHLSAGALGMTLVIALVLAFLMGFFVLRQHLSQLRILHFQTKERLMVNSRSGLELILTADSLCSNRVWYECSLFDGQADSVGLYHEHWGFYDLAISKAYQRGEHYTTCALAGASVRPAHNYALYCVDHGRSIIVSGHTAILGDALLPAMGIQAGVFEGQYFQGDQIVKGTIGNSQDALPHVEWSRVDSLMACFQMPYSSMDSLVEVSELIGDTIRHSFDHHTLRFHSNGPLSLVSSDIQGRIVITSNTDITVSSDSHLDNVILIAPRIAIEDRFQGNAQFIATQELEIGEGVHLDYPSVAALVANDESGNIAANRLHIGPNAQIGGLVALLHDYDTRSSTDWLWIEEGCKVMGEVYCMGRLQMEGSVDGTVWVDRFYRQSSSGVFEHHLLNSTICLACRPDEFLSTLLWKGGEKRILKWVF